MKTSFITEDRKADILHQFLWEQMSINQENFVFEFLIQWFSSYSVFTNVNVEIISSVPESLHHKIFKIRYILTQELRQQQCH